MRAGELIAQASRPAGVRSMARRALAAALGRFARGRGELVLPLARRPFEAYGALHFHQGFELVPQLGGSSRWKLLEDEVNVPTGAVLLIPRGVPHVEAVSRGHAESCNVNIYVSPDLITCHAFAMTSPEDRNMVGNEQLKPACTELLFDMFAETVSAYERGGPDSPAVKGLVLAALALLEEAFAAPASGDAEGGSSRLVGLCRQEVLRYLCMSSLNVAWLAEHLGCNADHLSHVFRRETGARLNRFINDERLKLGAYLLESSTLSIGEVASSCGYSDPDYFSRLFRRGHGRTPAEFREASRHAGAPAPRLAKPAAARIMRP